MREEGGGEGARRRFFRPLSKRASVQRDQESLTVPQEFV